MRVPEGFEESLAAKFAVVFPHLDERQRRLLAGAEARVLGHGGIRLVARAAGMREGTVSRGVAELESGREPLGRIRERGGGRKRAADLDPGLRLALLELVEPDMRGDPMSPLRWTVKSTRVLAVELTRQGHKAGPDTVAGLLRGEGFSLQGNAKTLEGRQNPDRDAQFRYISEQARDHQDAGDPVASVDTKKKELVGEYASRGRQWRPKGDPVQVSDHDFPGDLGKAIPYGIYDITANSGWVNVGTDHDTAAFAVESLRRWWNGAGRAAYPRARRLLITADAGGSNGYRTRAWKAELAALAAQTGLQITCCHFPPGTSKWNAIEHRLFSHITMNWRGRPLTSHEVIVNSIAATTTRTGLRVRAGLDDASYPTGTSVSDAQMAALPITRHDWHGNWNYTLHPAAAPGTRAAAPSPPCRPAGPDITPLLTPAITGMTAAAWDDLLARLAVPAQIARDLTRRAPGRRGRPPGPCSRLPLAAQLLATILNQRLGMPHPAIAELLQAGHTTIGRAIHSTRQLLAPLGYTIQPASTRITTPATLISSTARAAAGPGRPADLKPAC